MSDQRTKEQVSQNTTAIQALIDGTQKPSGLTALATSMLDTDLLIMEIASTGEVLKMTKAQLQADLDIILATINSDVSGEPSGSDVVSNVVSLTQAEYDSGTKIATTYYIITDAVTVSGLLFKKVILTADNLKSIGSIPIEAIPSVGLGTYIKVLSMDTFLNYLTSSFDDNAINLETVGATNVQITQDDILNASVNKNGSANNSELVDQFVQNASVMVTGTNSSGGSGSVNLYITYRTVTI
jgi:hypothetical protein